MTPTDKRAVIILAITFGLAFVAYTYVSDFGVYTARGAALHNGATSMYTPAYLKWLWW
jgi:hypothetical protein